MSFLHWLVVFGLTGLFMTANISITATASQQETPEDGDTAYEAEMGEEGGYDSTLSNRQSRKPYKTYRRAPRKPLYDPYGNDKWGTLYNSQAGESVHYEDIWDEDDTDEEDE